MSQIYQTLINTIEDTHSNSSPFPFALYGGATGELLFLLKAWGHPYVDIDEVQFHIKFELLQNNIANYQNHLSLSNGLLGLAWFMEFANQSQKEGYEADLCEELDNIILKHISKKSWQGEIEMVLGLAGVSVYASRRQLRSDQSAIYTQLLKHFERLTTKFEDGTVSWKQPQRSIYRINKEDNVQDEYNLGLAHGVPGIISALIPALQVPTIKEQTLSLLIKSCDWLLNQELNAENKKSCFATTTTTPHESRLGWCYGDLTISLTLLRVGKALNINRYIEAARRIALHASKRGLKSAVIYDAGVCHGSAGLALIFKLLYVELNEAELLEASNKWRDYTLELYQNKGLEGLYKFDSKANEYEECTGLLEGYAGIGLALLSIENNDFDWIDCLMLS